MAVAKFTLGADRDIDAFENYIDSILYNSDFKNTLKYWIKALDDTNTPFPTVSPIKTLSPTSAPSGVIHAITTNGRQTTKDKDVEGISVSDGTGTDEIELIVIICVVIGILLVISIAGFIIYRCYKKKHSQPDMNEVTLPSRTDLELEAINEGPIDETTALTPDSTHL